MYANGPKIVTDGLVLCLDAANRKSYPGTGTAWNDLSGNGNNGTLVNGPTFSSANGGNLSFDGTNDYTEVTTRNTNLEFQPTLPYSVFVFLKSPPSGSQSAIVSNLQGSTPYQGWDFFFNNASSANTIAMHFVDTWDTNAIKIRSNYLFSTYANKWVMLGYTYNGSSPVNSTDVLNSVNFYINGQLHTAGKTVLGSNADGFSSVTEVVNYNTSQRFRIGSRWASGVANYPSPITVGNVLLYNGKELSPNEVQQNYNALKGRYGLT
jgi:hypothetical protein